jgi:hypothetical protein
MAGKDMRGPEEESRTLHANRVQERRIDDRERQGYHVNRRNNNGDQASNSNDGINPVKEIMMCLPK